MNNHHLARLSNCKLTGGGLRVSPKTYEREEKHMPVKCNRRRKCTNKENCYHAEPHEYREDCHGDPHGRRHYNYQPCEYFKGHGGVKCKMVTKRIFRRKTKEVKGVLIPYTPLELEKALGKLRVHIKINKRLQSVKDYEKVDLKEAITGMSTDLMQAILPDYRSRKLDRYDIRTALYKEVERQCTLARNRTEQKYFSWDYSDSITPDRFKNKLEEKRRGILRTALGSGVYTFPRKHYGWYLDRFEPTEKTREMTNEGVRISITSSTRVYIPTDHTVRASNKRLVVLPIKDSRNFDIGKPVKVMWFEPVPGEAETITLTGVSKNGKLMFDEKKLERILSRREVAIKVEKKAKRKERREQRKARRGM